MSDSFFFFRLDSPFFPLLPCSLVSFFMDVFPCPFFFWFCLPGVLFRLGPYLPFFLALYHLPFSWASPELYLRLPPLPRRFLISLPVDSGLKCSGITLSADDRRPFLLLSILFPPPKLVVSHKAPLLLRGFGVAFPRSWFAWFLVRPRFLCPGFHRGTCPSRGNFSLFLL